MTLSAYLTKSKLWGQPKGFVQPMGELHSKAQQVFVKDLQLCIVRKSMPSYVAAGHRLRERLYLSGTQRASVVTRYLFQGSQTSGITSTYKITYFKALRTFTAFLLGQWKFIPSGQSKYSDTR